MVLDMLVQGNEAKFKYIYIKLICIAHFLTLDNFLPARIESKHGVIMGSLLYWQELEDSLIDSVVVLKGSYGSSIFVSVSSFH